MKRMTAIAFFALAALVTAGSAVAQGHAVQATVPFDFTVASAHVPAGTYTISSANQRDSNLIMLRNETGKVTIMAAAYANGKQSQTGKLVFDKLGDQYFLREILCASADMNLALPASKTEKKIASQQAMLPHDSQVFIALNEIK
jgi:hypothetical protein